MKKWLLYSSGICCAGVAFEGETVFVAPLDPATAAYLPPRALSRAENARFQVLTHLNLLELAQGMPEYNRIFSGAEQVYTSRGERYLKEGQHDYVQRDVKFPRNVVLAEGRAVGFVCPGRERVSVLVEEGYQALTVMEAWQRAYPEPLHPIRTLPVCTVMTRDGVALSTAVMLPANGEAHLPTLLVRTPYGKEEELPLYQRYVHRGYAVVIQDVRGRNLSAGEWIPNHYETEDGDDTLNWIAAQPWSNGAVGMLGGSYMGYVQWAAAASGNPHLKALVSVVCAGSAFVDMPRRGGAYSSGGLAWAFAVSQKQFAPALMHRDDWDAVLDIRPLEDLPQKALGYPIPFYTEWLRHTDCDGFWERGNWGQRGRGVVDVPALIVSGWFDDNGMGTTEALALTADYPYGKRKMILGPWQHSGNSRYDFSGTPLGNTALKLDLDLTFLQWFDFHLKGMPNGADALPPVEYYTLGENRWKTAENWPLPNAEPMALYLSSHCGANTSEGDGVLSFSPVSDGGIDRFRYDPEDPAPHIVDLSENELSVPADYTEAERRADMLCYTTPPLDVPLTFTGDFTVELYISSNAPDTDFVVRITDVDETGRSIKLADGVLSARYRNGFTCAQLMEHSKIYKLTIHTTILSHCFLPGHRVRLTVTSSAKNLIFPNSNTGEGVHSAITAVAENTVHHGGFCPSRVLARRER